MITYLLDDTDISPRVQTVLAQADALIERGHDVRIVTTADGPVTWRASRAAWELVDDLDPRGADVSSALRGRDVRAPHIILDDTFPWSDFLIVDDAMYRPRTPREHEPLRVLLDGPGVANGYGAAAHARWFHQAFELIRVSPWAPSREEPLDSVQEFHVALTTAEMTRLMHSCDVLVAPNHHQEGFGLPAAEALASGVPAVLTEIPSYLSWDETRDYALFAPEENAVELGERLIEILSDADLRERLRTRGREVAEQWRATCVADRLEAFFRR